jgi:hypothetical protein
MPKQKDLKRLVRTRMRKTGEAYTTARLQVVRRARGAAGVAAEEPSAAARATPSPSPDYAALAGMGDAAVRAKTGRDWAEWTRTLDAAGAAQMPHRQIAELVHGLGTPDWWSQTVTVGYERIRGLRDRGQRRGGAYEASKSRTLPVPLDRLYEAWATPRRRARWLGGVELRVRTANPGKTMRITWEDGTSVECYFTAKGAEKSQVAVQHRGLASGADAAQRKQFWAERLAALAELLASPPTRRRTSS